MMRKGPYYVHGHLFTIKADPDAKFTKGLTAKSTSYASYASLTPKIPPKKGLNSWGTIYIKSNNR